MQIKKWILGFGILLAILLFFASKGSTLTRYVDGTAATCADYDPATRTCGSGSYNNYNTVDGGVVACGTGDTLIIQPGDYSDAAFRSAIGNITIRGGTTDPNDVSIDLTVATKWFYLDNDDNLSIKYLTIKNSASNQYVFDIRNGSANFLAEKCRFVDCGRVVNVDASAGTRLTHCQFLGSTSSANYMVFKDASAIIDHCAFRMSLTNPMRRIYTDAAASSNLLNFYNCWLTGAYDYIIQPGRDADVISLRNCVVFGNGVSYLDGYSSILGSSAGVTVDHCLVLPSLDGSELDSQITETNPVDDFPKVTNYSRKGIFTFTIDDTQNYDDAEWLAEQMEAYGWHMSWAMYTRSVPTQAQKAAVANLINGGHDITCHSRSHPNLINLYAFTLSHATATMTISVTQSGGSATWTGTLSLSTGQSVNLHDTDYDTIVELVAYLDSLDGYTCTLYAETQQYCKSVCLADCTNQSLSGAGFTAYFDRNEYLTVEVAETKTALETVIHALPGEGFTCPDCATYEVKTFACPNNSNDDFIMDKAYSAGYEFLRGVHGSLTYPQRYLKGHSIFSSYAVGYSRVSELDPNSKSRISLNRIAGSLSFTCETGSIFNFYMHNLPEDYDDLVETEMTRADISALLAYLHDVEDQFLVIGSLRDASDYIRTYGVCSAGETDGSEQRWDLTFIDTFNSQLKANSPCIDTGLDLGSTYSLDWVGQNHLQDGRFDLGICCFPKSGGLQ